MQVEKKFYIANSKKFLANNFTAFKNRTALPNLQSNFRPLLSSPASQIGQKVYFRPQDLHQSRPASQHSVEVKSQPSFVPSGILVPPVPSAPARRVSTKNLFANNGEAGETAERVRSWSNTPEHPPETNWTPKNPDLFVTSNAEKKNKVDETITSSFLENLSDTSNTPTTTDNNNNNNNKNKEVNKPAGLNEAIIVNKLSSQDSNEAKVKVNCVKPSLNRQNSNDPTLERPPGRLNYYDSDTNTISEGFMITSNLIKRSNSEYLHKKTKSNYS